MWNLKLGALANALKIQLARSMSMANPGERLSALPKPVSPAAYSQEYFLEDCGGYREFAESHGLRLEPRLERMLALAQITPGERVLDLGCGRGELSLHAALAGARVFATDYSEQALSLTGSALIALPETERRLVSLIRADAKHLPWPDRTLDKAILSDIVEHLYPWELEQVITELARVLTPEGLLIVHTSPNRLHYDIGYRLLRLFDPLTNGRRSANPRTDFERLMHVNEQTAWGLRRALNRHFASCVWLAGPEATTRRWNRVFSILSPLAQIQGNDIWAVATPQQRGQGASFRQQFQLSAETRPRTPWPREIRASEAFAPYFGPGWYALEGDERPFRWSSEKARLFLDTTGASAVVFKVAGGPRPEGELARLELRVGRASHAFSLDPDWQTLRFPLTSVIPPGVPVTLRVRPGFLPAARGGEDRRRLGIALRRAWVE